MAIVEIRRTLVDHGIDERRVRMRQLVGIVTALRGLRAHLRIAQVREVRVVELDVPAARRVERGELVAIHLREVFEEFIQIRIRGDVDSLPSAAEVHHRRRRDGDLRRPGHDRPKKIEVGGLNVLDVPQLARDGHPRRCEVDLAGPRAELRRDAAGHGDALQPLQEVDVKERAAELAVGDALQPDRFLFPNHITDGFVFDPAELLLRDFTALASRARVFQMLGPEQTADVLGAKGRVQQGHWAPPGAGGAASYQELDGRRARSTSARAAPT